MGARINLFVGWYLVLQIFLNNVLAEFGTGLLGMLGMPEPLADRLGWLVGALFLVAILLVVRVYFKSASTTSRWHRSSDSRRSVSRSSVR